MAIHAVAQAISAMHDGCISRAPCGMQATVGANTAPLPHADGEELLQRLAWGYPEPASGAAQSDQFWIGARSYTGGHTVGPWTHGTSFMQPWEILSEHTCIASTLPSCAHGPLQAAVRLHSIYRCLQSALPKSITVASNLLDQAAQMACAVAHSSNSPGRRFCQ